MINYDTSGWPIVPDGYQYVPPGHVVQPQPIQPLAIKPIPLALATIRRTVDVETYRNYFLVKFRDRQTHTMVSIPMYAGRPLNIAALRFMLAGCELSTFNGKKYDMLMISAALTGRFDNDMLKRLSDYIILTKPSPQPWMVAREWGFELLENLDHVDWMEVAPGQASLKTYIARMHGSELQDLPYPPDTILTPEQMIEVDKYCGKDLVGTGMLADALQSDYDIRVELSAQYGVDMRSRSDAQIAEDAFKKLIPFEVKRRHIMPGYRFQYQPAPWLSFRTPELQEAFRRCCTAWFEVPESGKPMLPPELNDYAVHLGGMVYRMGNGGLHSSEEKISHRAGPEVDLVDVDFDSFYPFIIRLLGMYPEQMGQTFLTIYNEWIDTRIGYKRSGQKKKAGTFKIKINGTFGKLGSKYSILYAPELLIRTTLTGQLTLLMMIERMHLAGIEIIQANTDGIVTKCHPSMAPVRDEVVRSIERDTGMTTEATRYLAVYSRDVNNYLAAKPAYTGKDGVFHPVEFKAKGTYASEGLAKNPTAPVLVQAVTEYLLTGVPLERTIRACRDIRQFLIVRNATGGGEWVHETIDAERVGQKREALRANGWDQVDTKGHFWTDGCGPHRSTDEAMRMLISRLPRTYLGKVCRWYYGAGQRGHIATCKKGAQVAMSYGCKPCMDLPDVFPDDVDYDKYVSEATDMLRDLGVIS